MSVKGAHSVAIKSFNSNHFKYDIFRPNFQKPLVDKFLVDLDLMANSKPQTDKKIVELAAGTGKFTANLVEYGWKDKLTIVEPSEGMLQTFHKNFPEIKTFHGSSYKIPVEDHSIDAVVVAQGFHWFSDLESLKEIHRVLKPHGKFGCIWNFDGASTVHKLPSGDVNYILDPSINVPRESLDPADLIYAHTLQILNLYPWYQKVAEYVYNYDGAVPQYRKGQWKQLLNENPYFELLGIENLYFYKLLIEPNNVYDYWLTRSYITSLNDNEKLKFEQELNELVKQYSTPNDKVVKDGVEYLQRIMGSHSIVTGPK